MKLLIYAVSSFTICRLMKNWVLYIIVICLIGLFAACSQEQDHKGKTPLVRVAGKFLYKEDLRLAMPLNLSKDDSVLFAENYIRNWVEDVLLFDKAEGNIPDNDKVNELVENYRKALIVHIYQEELVHQKLMEEISEADMQAYYEENKALFILEEPVVKGLFMKVPLRSSGLADVRKWYKRNTLDAIENLEKYSLKSAVSYDYFYDHWKPVKELSAVIPVKELKEDKNYLNKKRDLEIKDTAYHYFLHIEDFQGEGKVKPFDFAKEEIKEILKNLKRVNFMNKVKDDLFNRASEKNEINYYLESNE